MIPMGDTRKRPTAPIFELCGRWKSQVHRRNANSTVNSATDTTSSTLNQTV